MKNSYICNLKNSVFFSYKKSILERHYQKIYNNIWG